MTIPRYVIAQSLTNWAAILTQAQVREDWSLVEHCRLNLLNCAGLLTRTRSAPDDALDPGEPAC